MTLRPGSWCLWLLLSTLFLSACATTPPSQRDDLCAIFEEKGGWYKDALKAEKKWGSPIPTLMAIINQESGFVADAQPPRSKILGFIPGSRPSSAYGYAQAKDEAWESYQKMTGNSWDDRDDFGDAIMFVGWYNDQSFRRNRIAKDNTRQLYLAYHEGHGGYAKKSYAAKKGLLKVADKVAAQAWRYRKQLDQCWRDL